MARGGRAVTRQRVGDDTDIVIHMGPVREHLMRVDDIPATINGWAEFNVANALAAAAMANCQGVRTEHIRLGLAGFRTSFEQCPGRLNFHQANGRTVLLDYAHNPAGLTELGKLVTRMRRTHSRVIGMVGIAGDRRDSDIRAMGAISAGLFDVIVIKEDDDLRGRRPGEVAELLKQGALEGGSSLGRIQTIANEGDAVRYCLRLAREGDLVVVTADDVEAVWRQIVDFDPRRLQAATNLAEGAIPLAVG